MIGDMKQNQMDKELLAWIDTIPFSKPTKNLMRDFSDAVLMAEVLKLYYPRHVEIHNYVPASNLNTKKENWNTLNRKVLAKIDMKLSKDMIHHLANASQGAIEKLLLELRLKILKNNEEMHRPELIKHNVENVDVQLSKEKIGDNISHDGQFNISEESSNKLDTDNEIRPCNLSRFRLFKRGILIGFSWITYFFRIWNIFSFYKLPHFDRHTCNAFIDVTTEQVENFNDETASRTIYMELKRELIEKEEIICTLTHKIAYLENSMKLKDLRISNLMTQILKNAVKIDYSAKPQSKDDTRAKLCSRSHNFYENKN